MLSDSSQFYWEVVKFSFCLAVGGTFGFFAARAVSKALSGSVKEVKAKIVEIDGERDASGKIIVEV